MEESIKKKDTDLTTLKSEEVKLQNAIRGLKKDIEGLKKEIQERDETIQDKVCFRYESSNEWNCYDHSSSRKNVFMI